MTLSNQQLVETKTENAEGVRNIQPRVARVSALPWVTRKSFNCNPERVADTIRLFSVANSFRVHSGKINYRYPGRCPGLEFANAFGV